MKYKTVSTIAAILLAVLCAVWTTGCASAIFAGSLLCWRCELATMKTSLDGTVVDENGVPLDDVSLVARYSYPTWDYTDEETKTERRTVDGEFDIWKLGYNEAELSFHKDGYYSQRYKFRGSFGPSNDDVNTLKQHDMRVVLRKKGPRAPLYLLTERQLNYDMGNGTKTICDLTDSDGPKMVRVALDEKPETAKYMELDFKRDDKGEIELRDFPGILKSTGEPVKYPAVFIFRFHSDDPDDGLRLIDEGESYMEQHPFDGTVPNVDFDRKQILERQSGQERDRNTFASFSDFHNTASEDGYTLREVAIPVEQLITMEKKDDTVFVSWSGAPRFMFLKCGGRYGKASLICVYSGGRNVSTGYGELGDKFNPHFSFNLFLNKEPGDTNLTSY